MNRVCSRSRGLVGACLLVSLCLTTRAAEEFNTRPPEGGIPVGNFGLGAEVVHTPSEGLRFRLGYNPPKFGPWLLEYGTLVIQPDGSESLFAEDVRESRTYPAYRIEDAHQWLEAVAPISKTSAAWSAAPLLAIRGKLSAPATARLTLDDRLMGECYAVFAGQDGIHTLRHGDSATLTLPAGDFDLVVIAGHPNSVTQRLVNDTDGEETIAHALAKSLLEDSNRPHEMTREWIDALPKSGDAKLDEYARWYLSAAVCLTRVAEHGAWPAQQREDDYPALDDPNRLSPDMLAITMGYREHNPRDTYWTSFPHVVFWPDLERDMIAMHFGAQGKDGSFQCAYPLFFRDQCIDWTGYVLHRLYRYAKYTGDWEFVKRCMNSGGIQAGIDFLLRRCEANGLPEHYDLWADWKDVSPLNERKYAAHSAFVTLAAFKATERMARKTGNDKLADQCRTAYDRGYTQVHQPVAEGGLWAGEYYVTRWKDGTADNIVQQDQVVGILFGVVPEERWQTVLDIIRRINHGPIGPRETYPYRDYGDSESFYEQPGVYHNGGVWPFMVGIEAICRISRVGTDQEIAVAKAMLGLVGYQDLERFGDYGPHEYLHGESGENGNFWLQGWSSMMAVAVWALDDPDHPLFESLRVD